MKTGYNWFLHDKIKSSTVDNNCIPQYDLVIMDGSKNWTLESSVFFLSDKLLKKNGWFIFDDFRWTYANAIRRGRTSTAGIAHNTLSEDEINLPHVREVFYLLVMQHPNYSNFVVQEEGDWAWARKIKSDKKNVNYVIRVSLGTRIFRFVKKRIQKDYRPV